MRKLILSFMILLGGIVNAQSFDFDCAEPEPEPNPNILEYLGVIYNFENNTHTLSFRGVPFNVDGGTFHAPEGAFNQDRYAGIGFRIREDGMWHLFYQNNGLGCRRCPIEPKNHTEDGDFFYNGGQVRTYNWGTFIQTVNTFFIDNGGTFVPSNVLFIDRNGPSVNYRRLNQWTGTSGWTTQPINGVSYPGNIRLTRNGDNWDVILKPHGERPSKQIRTNVNAKKVERDLSSIAGAYIWHYDHPEN